MNIEELRSILEEIKVNKSNKKILRFTLEYVQNHSYFRSYQIAREFLEENKMRYNKKSESKITHIISGYFSILLRNNIIISGSTNRRGHLFKSTEDMINSLKIMIECEDSQHSRRKLEERIK